MTRRYCAHIPKHSCVIRTQVVTQRGRLKPGKYEYFCARLPPPFRFLQNAHSKPLVLKTHLKIAQELLGLTCIYTIAGDSEYICVECPSMQVHPTQSNRSHDHAHNTICHRNQHQNTFGHTTLLYIQNDSFRTSSGNAPRLLSRKFPLSSRNSPPPSSSPAPEALLPLLPSASTL